MESARLQNISPLDHRYYISHPEFFRTLSAYLSEEASIAYELRVEAALIKGLLRRLSKKNAASLAEHVDNAVESIQADEVYKEESVTQHHIRALVNVLKKHLPESLRPYVHLGATSTDIVDTAFALRLRDFSQKVMIPLLASVVEKLIDISQEHEATPQIGRTHGQFALPITFGYALSEYIVRIGALLPSLLERSQALCGKLSGAVGGYHALGLIVADPEDFEKEVMAELNLKTSDFSSQILPPETSLRLLFEHSLVLGVAANLADDIRHLQRSEIGELKERFTQHQVGSSTMPHKRNPWNCEHIKSLWKTFSPRLMTFMMDQISEHQRDLTNSASGRFSVEFLAGCASAISRLESVLSTLHVDHENMQRNIQQAGDAVLAEPLYILLSLSQSPDGYEEMRQATLEASRSGLSLLEVLTSKTALWKTLEAQAESAGIGDLVEFLAHPEQYRGVVVERSHAIREKYRSVIKTSLALLGVAQR